MRLCLLCTSKEAWVTRKRFWHLKQKCGPSQSFGLPVLLPSVSWIHRHGVASSQLGPSLWLVQPTTPLKMRQMQGRETPEDGARCAHRMHCCPLEDPHHGPFPKSRHQAINIPTSALNGHSLPQYGYIFSQHKGQWHSLRRQVGCFSLTLLIWPKNSTSRGLASSDHV